MMEVTVQIPFQQLLSAVKTLTATEKARLKQELIEEQAAGDKAQFLEMLLKGPVYTESEIQTIEENRNSIAKWRTKS